MVRSRGRWLAFSFVLLGSCVSKECSEHQGPRVIVGTKDKILSPFPADRLTLPDPTTPTGLRVDLPIKDDATELERLLTKHANRLDGFGVSSPLCVRFDRPLDLASITPDSCYLVNITDGSVVPLDYGSGAYPVELARPLSMFPNDPQTPSIILAPDNPATYYEDRTNALLLRPRFPLKPASKHVAILTRRLRGTNGDPIEAPPNEPPTPQEFDDFSKAATIVGLAPIEVAFYWTFTTHSVSWELESIRRGLDGEGPFARLESEFPAKISSLHDLKYGLTDGNPYTLEASVASALFKLLDSLAQIIKPIYPGLAELTGTYVPFIAEMKNVDYFVFGTVDSPNFVENPEGTFAVDPGSGNARVVAGKVPFMLTIPKPTAENGYAKAPYPVVVHGHGLTVSRLQAWPLADRLAAKGLAGACIDLVAHGPMEQFYMFPRILRSLDGALAVLARPVVFSLGLLLGVPVNPFDPLPQMVDQVFSQGVLAPITGEGRAKDVDGDGDLDPTEGFFSSDFFQLRDNIRQCVVDQMFWVRVLRGLGRDANGNHVLDPEEGDVNGDGVADLGGPDVPITYAGVSLGSIIGGTVMAVDPKILTGVLNVAGGGLGDIMFRTTVLDEVFVRRVTRDVFGLAVVGRPKDGQVHFTFNSDPVESSFLSVPLGYASYVEVRNVTKQNVYGAAPAQDGSFAVVVAADKGDTLEVNVTVPKAGTVQKTVAAPYSGLGVARGSTRAREFNMLLAWFMESADPVCYAPHWWQRPLADVPEKSILIQLSSGDPIVPVAGGVTLARAAGLVSPQRMAELVELGVPAGANLAVDKSLPVEAAQFRALRFHASGKHAGIIGGNGKQLDDSIKMGLAAQTQLAAFLATAGAVITTDPVFDLVLPDDNGKLLFSIPLPFGIGGP